MTNGRIDAAQVDVIISGGRKEIDRLVVTGMLELRATVQSIEQHCRFCDTDSSPPQDDRRTWAMWGIGRWLLDRVLAVAIASAITCIITLALTGQLGG